MTRSFALPWLIAAPLALAILSYVAPRAARRLTALGVFTLLIAASMLAWRVQGGAVRYRLGGWEAPLGIELYADGLSALMILMTAGVAAGVFWYARSLFTTSVAPLRDRFWPLAWMLWAAMNAVYASGDVFNLYVTLELLGLSAVGLIALSGSRVAITAAMRYLLWALLGSFVYLLGVAMLYGAHGVLALQELALRITPGPLASFTLALMTAGLLVKAALFPLHFWLPPAHGSALAPVSALLSALVTKAAFYIVARLWFDVFGPAAPAEVAQVLGAFGAAALVWGALSALRQRKLKMLVAYSTVAQLGNLFIAVALGIGAEPAQAAQAWTGAAYFAVSHAFAKAAMFLAAGTIVHAWGEDDIEHLEGTSAQLPWSLFAFGAAGVTMIGLPPSGAFVAKWLLLQSAIGSAQWWWAVALLLGGLLTALYVFRVLRSAFFPTRADRTLHAAPRGMQMSALALAVAALVLGLVAAAPIDLLHVGRSWPALTM